MNQLALPLISQYDAAVEASPVVQVWLKTGSGFWTFLQAHALDWKKRWPQGQLQCPW